MQYGFVSSPPGGLTIGDVAVGEDGKLYAVMLDNSGTTCWVCIEDADMSSIIAALLRTIKWSTHMAKMTAVDAEKVSSVGKRKKTAYNRHIGKTLKDLAVSHPDMPRKERMRIAVTSWKDIKDKSELLAEGVQKVQIVSDVANPLADIFEGGGDVSRQEDSVCDDAQGVV